MPKHPKGGGKSRMYTFDLPILYSEDTLRGAFSGQYPSCLHILLHSKVLIPLGFFCGGFSSTAGYVSGNEAQHPKTRAT